jgi:hypothetical protein
MLMKQITSQHQISELYYRSYTNNTFKQQHALLTVA